MVRVVHGLFYLGLVAVSAAGLFCLLPTIAPQLGYAADGLLGTPDQDRAEIRLLCQQQAFGQDCSCVAGFDADLTNEGRKFLLLVLREKPIEAQDYLINYRKKPDHKSQSIIIEVARSASAISAACHFKPSITNYVFYGAKTSRLSL